MRFQVLLSREELEEVPRRYRWLLKLFLKFPNPSLPQFILNKLPWLEGVFWGILVPVFLVSYFFFSIWLLVALTLFMSFPFNVLLWLSLPMIVLVLFLRIEIERTILFWRSLRSKHKDRDIAKVTKEFFLLLEKQQKRKREKLSS